MNEQTEDIVLDPVAVGVNLQGHEIAIYRFANSFGCIVAVEQPITQERSDATTFSLSLAYFVDKDRYIVFNKEMTGLNYDEVGGMAHFAAAKAAEGVGAWGATPDSLARFVALAAEAGAIVEIPWGRVMDRDQLVAAHTSHMVH